MGYGDFKEEVYRSSVTMRATKGIRDFEYTTKATRVHEILDPQRIRTKPFGLLESRDSADHSESLPIILTFDVTGSNKVNAIVAQKKLPELMGKLTAVHPNPQIAVWANDDVRVIGKNGLQLGEFESDNRIDESIRSIWITGKGGGNSGESYDLLIYAAARKTVTDSFEKRGKKGYMFLYADEPFFSSVEAEDVNKVFNDGLEVDIPIGDIIAEARQKWSIFVIWPQDGYRHARQQYVTLFGEDHVEDLQSAEMLCDKVASIVDREEKANTSASSVQAVDVSDLEFARVE